MSEPSLMVLGERRKRGRPQTEERHASISTWVPTSLHDRVISVANANAISVSELVRRALVITLKHSPRTLVD